MIGSFSRNWWYFLLRGIITLFFGVLLIIFPIKTLLLVTLLLGLLFIIDGILATILSFINHNRIEKWGLVLARGVFNLMLGLVIFMLPKTTVEILVFLSAMWLMVVGILELVTAVRIRKETAGEWMITALGIITFLASLLLFTKPVLTVVFFSVLFGGLLIVWGIFMTAFSFELRSFKKIY